MGGIAADKVAMISGRGLYAARADAIERDDCVARLVRVEHSALVAARMGGKM